MMDFEDFFDELDTILDAPMPGNADGLELESQDEQESGEVLQ